MKDHELILKMIEEVDPSETIKLDEIDARVWCYLTSPPASLENFMEWWDKNKEGTISNILYNSPERKYTRSRDALKAIRPEGCGVSVVRYIAGWCEASIALKDALKSCVFFGKEAINTPPLPTEELAELHAIIQAIAYERGL